MKPNKRMRNLLYLFLFPVLIGFPLAAQIPLGSWRMHLPYNQALGMERVGDELFVATRSGLFRYNTRDESIEILNKVNGLSDIGITSIAKHPTQNVLMLGYENGNLDLFMDNRIYNLRDILNSDILGSRRINRIKFSGSFAYLACDFGMVVYNFRKREVRVSNLLMGAAGNAIKVFDCAKFRDSIYALTPEGLKSVSVFQDFKNTSLWARYIPDEVGLPNDNNVYQTIDSLDGNLIIATRAFLHPKRGNKFPATLSIGGAIRKVRSFDGKYVVCAETDVLEVNPGVDAIVGTLDQEYYKKISAPTDVLYDAGGIRWVTDQNNGLLKITPTDTLQILPNGPLFNGSFSLTSYGDQVVMCSGGYTFPTANFRNNNGSGFAILSGNNWTTYNRFITPGLPKANDFVRSYFNPFDQKLYLSSFGTGIVVKEGESFRLINDSTTNGGLCNLFARNCVWRTGDPGPKDYVTVTSVTADATGDLWVTNFEAPDGAVRRFSQRDGTWSKFTLPSANSRYALEITSDQSNFKWIRMAPGRDNGTAGIWILNSDATEQIRLNTQANQGGLPSSDVYDIKEDKNGYIWVGTAKGLAVFYNPYNAFFVNGITASTPIYPPEAGRPVLENDVVTSIAIDGANRKWVGTKDNGVWLFNADITEVVHHFTINNSPLISNYIYDIVVNDATGEVFFATDQGLVSFQGDATSNPDPASCDEDAISLFPNPVSRGYEGLIAVRGLAGNAEVRFVTASGKLVYQTTAKGGMATWNGRTYDGKKAQPGIYLVLSSTEDGKANCVSKLALLH